MAQLLKREEYFNESVKVMKDRLTNQYATFLQRKPTLVTYYHVNPTYSTTDTGTRDVEGLIDEESPTRWNRIIGMPLFMEGVIKLDIQDSEVGMDTQYDGTCIIAPNTIEPVPDDYFWIPYLGKEYLFRVNHVNYDTIKSNGYYEVNFHLEYTSIVGFNRIERLVIEEYHCIFDNIGTKDKSIIRTSDYTLLRSIDAKFKELRALYKKKFINPKYNAAMYFMDSFHNIYDPLLNHFINKAKIWEPEVGELEIISLYEEKRPYTGMDFEDSIYERVLERDKTDINQINRFYGTEPSTVFTESIFFYYRDDAVKYVSYYNNPIGPFGNRLSPYLSNGFYNSLYLEKKEMCEDDYERLVWTYMFESYDKCIQLVNKINTKRMPYNFHTYTMVPLVLYTLRQILKDIKVDLTALDDHLVHKNTF